MQKQRGFTLVELVVTVGVVAVLLSLLAPLYQAMMSSQDLAYVEKHKVYNKNIGDALLSHAKTYSAVGALPTPYTGASYTKTVYNDADVTTAGIALSQALTQGGVPPNEINDDGTTGANVRVFQVVTGLTKQVPLYVQSGPLATVTYQYGAIYMTSCQKLDSSCNPTPATGVPGSSTAMTSANYSTWKTIGTDHAAHTLSTLPIQRDMLATTAQRLDKLRDSFLSYFRAAQITAAAGDATNFYPTDSTSLGGQNPATNQSCRDGWYSLSTSGILAKINLSSSEYGKTAWGGDIQYCRDYDATGTEAPNASPHSAALRIRSSVSSGSAPDSVVSGNNLVLTF